MAKAVTYVVKIPTENGDYEITEHKNAKEVGKYLDVGEKNVYHIVNGTCLFNDVRTRKLKNVIIIKK